MQTSAARITKQEAVKPRQRFVLQGVSWQDYEKIGEALANRSSLRLTYDRGVLEFMSTSPEHEKYKSIFAILLWVLAEETDTEIVCFGSATWKREDLEKGLEPDQCFYLANLARIRGMKRFDPARHPPPDLVIEIEVSRSAVNRMHLYAALGVPEVWRFDGEELTVHLLRKGQYQAGGRSQSFPRLQVQDLVQFVGQGEVQDDIAVARACRAWVRKQLARKKPKA